MNFIFKYIFYAKIFIKSYLMTYVNVLYQYLCPILITLSQMVSFPVPNIIIENNDEKFQILEAFTSDGDITNQMRIYCYMNDVIFIDELIKVLQISSMLSIMLKNESNMKIYLEINIKENSYYANINDRHVQGQIQHNQVIFNPF